MSPYVCFLMPRRILKVTDLPAPLGPKRPNISPWFTCMFIFLSINLFFMIFEIECVDNIGFFDLNDKILNFFILAIK